MKIASTIRSAMPQEQGKVSPGRRHEQGFAVLVVFILMVLMFGLVIQSGLVLRGLHQELRLLEKRQIKKFAVPVTRTNAAPTQASPTPKLTDDGQNQLH
jgi:hypothetical protein